MRQIYKGNMKNYDNQLLFKDIDINHLDWIWSGKKKKHYHKESRTINMINYMFVLFRNGYVLVYVGDSNKSTIEPIRNYYHIFKEGLCFKINPEIEMPF